MSTAGHRVDAILAGEAPGSEEGPSKCELIEELLPELGWDAVLDHLLAVLRQSERCPADWTTAAEVLWGALLDARAMPADVVVAHLCNRWCVAGSTENNLAWSIISKLKQVEYLSPYDPLADAGVQRELARLRVGDRDAGNKPVSPTDVV